MLSLLLAIVISSAFPALGQVNYGFDAGCGYGAQGYNYQPYQSYYGSSYGYGNRFQPQNTYPSTYGSAYGYGNRFQPQNTYPSTYGSAYGYGNRFQPQNTYPSRRPNYYISPFRSVPVQRLVGFRNAIPQISQTIIPYSYYPAISGPSYPFSVVPNVLPQSYYEVYQIYYLANDSETNDQDSSLGPNIKDSTNPQEPTFNLPDGEKLQLQNLGNIPLSSLTSRAFRESNSDHELLDKVPFYPLNVDFRSSNDKISSPPLIVSPYRFKTDIPTEGNFYDTGKQSLNFGEPSRRPVATPSRNQFYSQGTSNIYPLNMPPAIPQYSQGTRYGSGGSIVPPYSPYSRTPMRYYLTDVQPGIRSLTNPSEDTETGSGARQSAGGSYQTDMTNAYSADRRQLPTPSSPIAPPIASPVSDGAQAMRRLIVLRESGG